MGDKYAHFGFLGFSMDEVARIRADKSLEGVVHYSIGRFSHVHCVVVCSCLTISTFIRVG